MPPYFYKNVVEDAIPLSWFTDLSSGSFCSSWTADMFWTKVYCEHCYCSFPLRFGKSLVHLQQLLRASSQVLISYTTNFITFIFRSFLPFYIKFFTQLLTLVLLSVYFVKLPQILYRSRDFTSASGVWDRLMLASRSALSTSLPKSNFSDSINIGSLKQATVVVLTPWIPTNITNRMFCPSKESVY